MFVTLCIHSLAPTLTVNEFFTDLALVGLTIDGFKIIIKNEEAESKIPPFFISCILLEKLGTYYTFPTMKLDRQQLGWRLGCAQINVGSRYEKR